MPPSIGSNFACNKTNEPFFIKKWLVSLFSSSGHYVTINPKECAIINQIKERFRKELLESCVPFWLNHAIDTEYGEWFGYLRRDGKPTEPPCKGHTDKGPFHVMRMLAKCLTLMK